MNAERWNQVQTLFKEILELDRDSQISRLNEIRDTDAELFGEIDSLLAADTDRSSILDGFAVDSIDISGLFSMKGKRIGAFEIDEQIGSGGMGSVFLAHRVEGGFEQQIALKLIRFGMDSEPLLHRFESERRILARLEHPNIARLVDGGFTGEGRPWFAMEYVEGESLLDYSKRLNLPLKKRLELFLDVSDAVQYAHRNLIVHRDLKPANILVTTAEGFRPKVKLLDFGIAQILEEADPAGEGQKAMTRAYASPEQKEGTPTTILTDIYSLGILLYELLSGCHPEPEFRTEDEAPKPIPRELQAICNKAMIDEPTLRFETVSEMEEELRAWLEKRPVACFSQKPLYWFKKLADRNRIAAGTLFFSLLAIILLVFIYTRQLRQEKDRAEQEAQRTSRVASVLGSSLRSIDPFQNGGKELSARTMLDESTTLINNRLGDDPRTRSKLLIMMAGIYANLGAYNVADSISLSSKKLMESTDDTVSFDYINMLAKRAVILDQDGKFEESEKLISKAVALANAYLSPSSLNFASVHLDYIYSLDGQGEYAKADSVLKMINPIYERNKQVEPEGYADFIFFQGTINRRLGNYKEAEKYLFQSLKISRERYPEVHEQIASTLNHISSLYQNMGKSKQAIPYAIESYEMRKKIFGHSYLSTMASHANIARAYLGAGMLEKAAETYRDVIALFRKEFGNKNFYIAGLLQSYANVYIRMKDYKRAEQILRESLKYSKELLPEGHLRMAYPLKSLANALKGQKRYKEALPYVEQAYKIRSAQLPEDNAFLISTRLTLGYCLWQLGRYKEAEPHLKSALAFYNTDPDRYQKEIEEINSLGVK